MQTLFIALGAMVLYLVAYHTYGKYLARKIFKLDPKANVPSIALRDNNDYMPTSKGIIFGHHFTSIAGTGPIVGPAIAVIWGWVPALLWVLFGSIFIGALHDFGSLVVSMRNRGQTVGDIAGRVLNPRIRFLFLLVLFLALTIVLAIFGLVIGNVFKLYPASIIPCLFQIPLALIIGVTLHQRGVNLKIPSLIALGIMMLSVAYGNTGGLKTINESLAAWPMITWVGVLLVYSYVASVLPVWMLLQPRDFINSLQLLTTLGLVILGLVAASFFGGSPVEGVRPPLEITGPAFNIDATGAPMMIPFLFITIACGAISGFHCLVSSGTSSKQLKCETDAQFVGYGSMLIEGLLATLVILACVSGLGLGVPGKEGAPLLGIDAWNDRYASWDTAKGLAAKLGAFVDGSGNFLKALGLPAAFSMALMGVLVASFAATTLDTACRLQRYVIQELANSFAPKKDGRPSVLHQSLGIFRNKHGATLFAIVLAALMAAWPLPGKEWAWENAGKGGLILWPMFGATNQLLGGLAFLVIAFWLWRRQLPVWFVVIPTVFMIVVPGYAMVHQLFLAEGAWWSAEEKNWALISIALTTMILQAWMIIEAAITWPKVKGCLEEDLPPLSGPEPHSDGGRSC